jgi:hypothetical protein
MVSPKLILLYAKTWKYILKDGGPSEEDLGKFSDSLQILKLALSCCVCRGLLKGTELYSPADYSDCYHFVCRGNNYSSSTWSSLDLSYVSLLRNVLYCFRLQRR